MDDFVQDLGYGEVRIPKWPVSAVQLVEDDAEGVDVAFLRSTGLVLRQEGLVGAEQFRRPVQQSCKINNRG